MRPSLDTYLMSLAGMASYRTTCIRRGVGCVLADGQGHVLAVAYNGVASGLAHCNEAEKVPVYRGDSRVHYSVDLDTYQFKGITSGRIPFIAEGGQCVGFDVIYPHVCPGHDLPPGQDSCEAVHAEANALLQCGDPKVVATAYVTLSPCKPCLKLLINTGCRRIVVAEELSDQWSKEQWLKLGRQWEKLEIN